jgi:hypothetical protein
MDTAIAPQIQHNYSVIFCYKNIKILLDFSRSWEGMLSQLFEKNSIAMTHSKLLPISLLALGYLIGGCGQPQVSNSAQAAQSTAAIAPTVEAPAIEPIVAAEPEMTAAEYYAEWQRISSQSCDKMRTEKGATSFQICVEDTGRSGGGDARIISASAASIELGDGVGYWFAEDGKVIALQFFHTGETFMFNPETGRLEAKVVSAMEVESVFSDEQRDRLETQAREGADFILDEFRGEM